MQCRDIIPVLLVMSTETEFNLNIKFVTSRTNAL